MIDRPQKKTAQQTSNSDNNKAKNFNQRKLDGNEITEIGTTEVQW